MGLAEFNVVDISEFSVKCMDGYTIITKEDWEKEGERLFGPDKMKWRFVCPACGNVASVGDYERYKEQGAKPDSATNNCIGRYDGHLDVKMGSARPCNYAGYGLFDLCPVRVFDNGEEIRCFAFDRGG